MNISKFLLILINIFAFSNISSIILDFKVGSDILKGDNRAFVAVDYPTTRKTFSLGPNEDLKIEETVNGEKLSEMPETIEIQMSTKEQDYGVRFPVSKDLNYVISIDDSQNCSHGEPLADRQLICVKETKETPQQIQESKEGEEVQIIDIK